MSAKIKKSSRGYHHYRPKGVKARHFERVYWPYLPLLAIIGGLAWYAQHNGNLNYAVQYGIRGQTYDPKLAVLPFSSQMAAVAIWSVFFLALGALIFRHSRQLKRSLINGEKYIFSHPVLDFSLIVIVSLTYLISQTSAYTF